MMSKRRKTYQTEAFQKTYENYLKQLKKCNLFEQAKKLELNTSGKEIIISIFNFEYRVSHDGIISQFGNQAEFEECIIIFKYLLIYPETVPKNSEWVAYNSFKDAQPLVDYFEREIIKPIEKTFSGNLRALENAGMKMNGNIYHDNAFYDLSIQFKALSKIPILLRFNDADKEFPARCIVLFKFSVKQYLDMESVGILGSIFAKTLIKNAKS